MYISEAWGDQNGIFIGIEYVGIWAPYLGMSVNIFLYKLVISNKDEKWYLWQGKWILLALVPC